MARKASRQLECLKHKTNLRMLLIDQCCSLVFLFQQKQEQNLPKPCLFLFYSILLPSLLSILFLSILFYSMQFYFFSLLFSIAISLSLSLLLFFFLALRPARSRSLRTGDGLSPCKVSFTEPREIKTSTHPNISRHICTRSLYIYIYILSPCEYN